MRAWLLVIAAGCHSSPKDDYPIVPGGGPEPGVGGQQTDAEESAITFATVAL